MAYVVGAKTLNGARKYAEYLRRNANGSGKGSAEVEHRSLGGDTSSETAEADHAWVCKITGAVTTGGASYNVTVHETLDGASVGTGILQVAEKHIAETLATGRIVAGMPHNLVITSVVGSEGV